VLVLGYTLTSSGLLFPLFLGRFWKRASRQGALAGMLAGVGVALLFSFVPVLKAACPAIGAGLLASLAAMVLASLIWPRKIREASAVRPPA